MITKGIVEKIIDTYTAKVRLPVYDGMPIGTISVPTDDLSSATVCTISGAQPNLRVGDVVFVGFEDNDRGKPVILGCLYSPESENSVADLTVSSLNVLVDTNLSEDTHIGDVTPQEISNLRFSKDNLQVQIDNLANSISTSGAGTITEIQRNGVTIATEGVANILVPTKLTDLLNDGSFVQDANYVHTDNNFTDALKEKLEDLEPSGEPNVIEIIKINSVALPVDTSDKSVNIPIATTSALGVVLSSTGENMISVDGSDGTMEINSLNCNKLVQTEGDELLLECGNRNGGWS